MREVEAIIIDAGKKSLNAIYANLAPHYIEEVPMICKHIYPWIDAVGSCEASITDKDVAKLKGEPYLGATYPEWININAQSAVKSWESAFRATQNGKIRTIENSQNSTILMKQANQALTTMEKRIKTVFVNAMIQVSRQAQADVEQSIWQ
jgi:hypothetical protein